MLQNIPSKKVRLNVQIPFELKDKLTWASVIEGKKMSVLVRESIEQELRRIEKKASYPICVVIKKGRGLKKDSIVNLSQIRTIDKKRLIAPKITELSNNVIKQVDKAIICSMGLHKLG